MSLFFGKKKKKQADRPVFSCSVPYSEHFKGYKRITISKYSDPIAEAGLKRFKAAPDAKVVTFEEYLYPDTSPLMRVIIDGNRVGTIWSTSYEDYYKKIRFGKCVRASVGYNDWDNVFLFVKFSE